jgi:phosphoenolpyruvate-protein kinase (PTS system EI component)
MVDELAHEAGLTKEEYRFGSMLETLDACANIKDIAPLCDFISIGSNDLTSETLKCDRNDWIKRQKLTDHSGTNSDPFVVLHPHVAKIIRTAVRKARAVCPGLQIDLCGAHATNLPSLLALHDLDLDGVSAPPSDMNQEGLRACSGLTGC